MPNWSISVLGDASLVLSGSGRREIPASGWPLIGLLLCQAGHRAHRAQIAAALWPDHDEERGRHCLATALWRFKRAFRSEGTLIEAEDETLRLARPLWVDAEAFAIRVTRALDLRHAASRSMRARLLRAGLRLYRGQFLGDLLSEWVLLERERLACLRLDGLHALATLEAESGNWDAALAPARLLCAVEPLREDGHRLLMEAYAATGNRGLALRQYRLCADILGRELSVDPMPETCALARRLAGSRSAGPAIEPGLAVSALVATRATLVATIGSIDAALEASQAEMAT